MLGKLMKYEFKATARTFLPMFGALIVISLVNRLFASLDLSVPKGISLAISIFMMVAICVAALLITLQRFNRNLLQNEGYLTMTLPVRTEKLILSKLFVSSIWYIACFIVVIISIVLLTITDVSWSDVFRFIDSLFKNSPFGQARTTLLLIEAIIAVIAGMFSSTLLIYSCLSLGMLVNNRRGLLAFGAFIAITTAMQALGSAIIAIIYATDMWRVVENWSLFALAQLTMLGTIALSLVLCAVFFWLTRHMLKNRLNLQ